MDWQAVALVLGEALKLVAQVVAQKGSDDLKDALAGLLPLIAAVESGNLAGIDPARARAELDIFVARLLADRAEADAALAAKFDHTEE